MVLMSVVLSLCVCSVCIVRCSVLSLEVFL